MSSKIELWGRVPAEDSKRAPSKPGRPPPAQSVVTEEGSRLTDLVGLHLGALIHLRACSSNVQQPHRLVL